MKEMMNQGTLPRRLLKVDTPFCAACQYGKMTRRPWWVKGDAQYKTKIATQPGQVVSVDQLESSTLGLVAQLKGILTTQRYKYASFLLISTPILSSYRRGKQVKRLL